MVLSGETDFTNICMKELTFDSEKPLESLLPPQSAQREFGMDFMAVVRTELEMGLMQDRLPSDSDKSWPERRAT